MPIVFNNTDYKNILNSTRNEVKNIIPKISGGDFTDKYFKPFFDLLKIQNRFTWDLSCSEYYLRQKMLTGNGNSIDIKDYSKIINMIFNEKTDAFVKEKSSKAIIVDSRGNTINSDNYNVKDIYGTDKPAHIGKETELLLANLSWLAFRTIFYTIVSYNTSGSLVLNPIRNAFQINYLYKITNDSNLYQNMLRSLNVSSEMTVKAIHSATQHFAFRYNLPMFSLSIIKNIEDPLKIIDEVLNMRQEGPFVKEHAKGFVKIVEINEDEHPLTLEEMYPKNSPDFKYGWISPDGDTFNTGYEGHLQAASSICEEYGYNSYRSEQELEDKGWVKVTGKYNHCNAMEILVFAKDNYVTKKQADTLFDLKLNDNHWVQHMIEYSEEQW